MVCQEIATKLGVNETWLVSDTVDTELTARIEDIQTLSHEGKPYKTLLVELTKYLREMRNLGYNEIAELVGLPELEIYDIVFNYPVTPSKTGYKKNSFTREEKTYRDEAMVKMNTEGGLTLQQIGNKLHLTKQRVSAIFKDLSYTPINTHHLKTITAEKYADKFAEIAEDDMAAKILALQDEIRTLKQRSAVTKYHYNKTIISLRCRLIMQYMLRWSELTKEERADYGAHRRVLEQIGEDMKNDTEYTQEQAMVKEMLIRVDTFEKTNDEAKKLLQSDLPTYNKIKERISKQF